MNEKCEYIPFHNNKKDLLVVDNVLVDIDNLHNVLASLASAPLQVDLSSSLLRVAKGLEGILHIGFLVRARNDLATDAESEHLLGDDVVVVDRIGLGPERDWASDLEVGLL